MFLERTSGRIRGREHPTGSVAVVVNLSTGTASGDHWATSIIGPRPPQSFQNPLNRSDASLVYRTVEAIQRWPR